MFQVFGILMLVGIMSMLVGIIAHWGTDVSYGVTSNAAATIGLLFIFACVVISCSSAKDYLSIIGNLQNAIPYLDGIADYGSFSNLIKQDPLTFVLGFLDSVFLTAFIDFFSPFFSEKHTFDRSDTAGKARMFPVIAFLGTLLALIGLFVLHLIKQSSLYVLIVTTVFTLIMILTTFSFVGLTVSALRETVITSVAAFMIFFSKGPLAVGLRNTVMKAFLLTIGILLIERCSGSLAMFASSIASAITAFAPIVLMIAGLWIMLASILKRW